MNDKIKKLNIAKLSILCKKHNVAKLYLFGSYAKQKQTEKSDIDLLVTFENVDLYNYFDNYIELKNELENEFKRNVDLVEEQTLKNPFLIESINQSKQYIYG